MPWVHSCPPEAASAIEAAGTTRFLLLARTGPMGFVLQAAGGAQRRRKVKVLLGNPHVCGCGQHGICVHIAWVLTKCLRMPAGSQLLWQPALVDRELAEVLR